MYSKDPISVKMCISNSHPKSAFSPQISVSACLHIHVVKESGYIVHYSALCCFDLHTTFITLIQIQKLDITKCLGVILNEKSSIVTHMKTH